MRPGRHDFSYLTAAHVDGRIKAFSREQLGKVDVRRASTAAARTRHGRAYRRRRSIRCTGGR
jgi:hypothetical protein